MCLDIFNNGVTCRHLDNAPARPELVASIQDAKKQGRREHKKAIPEQVMKNGFTSLNSCPGISRPSIIQPSTKAKSGIRYMR